MVQGWFISVEGGEGAGKTSVIRLMEQYLRQRDFGVVVTREPGGIEIAEQIRKVILDKANTSMDGRTEALLYAAARRQHLVEKVIPAIERGMVVICDRFIDSSLAYQGFARGLGVDDVYAINLFATDGMLPDMTFWLDIAPERGLERIHADRGREVNRLDLEGLAFHEKVREGYRLVQRRFPERVSAIDADRPLDDVFEDVKRILDRKLEEGIREKNV